MPRVEAPVRLVAQRWGRFAWVSVPEPAPERVLEQASSKGWALHRQSLPSYTLLSKPLGLPGGHARFERWEG